MRALADFRKREGRHHDAHQIFGRDRKFGRAGRQNERLAHGAGAGQRACRGKRAVHQRKLVLNLLPHRLVLADNVEKAAHQLVAFIFEQFMAAARGGKLVFEVFQLHARRVDSQFSHFVLSFRKILRGGGSPV